MSSAILKRPFLPGLQWPFWGGTAFTPNNAERLGKNANYVSPICLLRLLLLLLLLFGIQQ